ncbi:hypothetical protein L2719_15080 [Shewanella schlegeliana]|nr:hypothetical protein [Shewanella schlegeliana]MCL1110858.1 hypothetical protein [Shewanella schlegeliana]
MLFLFLNKNNMLKNWTVTTQAVKNGSDGVITRERYLLSHKHPNHKHTEKLISIIGNTSTSQRIAITGERFRLLQQLNNTRGGRPLSSYAMEFCLTLPKGHRPTPKQWHSITSDCCLQLAKLLKLTLEEREQYKTQIRAVLHQQPQTGRTGTGDHLHLIIGKVVGNRVLKQLQQKQATRLIKSAFNAAVLKHIGIDHREYKPYELERGKRLEMWKYQHQKAQDSLWIQKLITKLQKQADKWFQALDINDDRQQKRQWNRILKSFEELSNCSLSEEQQGQISNLKVKVGIH